MASRFSVSTCFILLTLTRTPSTSYVTGPTFKYTVDNTKEINAEGREPRLSYVIYDGDERTLPGKRPYVFQSPRPWHLEFNQRSEKPTDLFTYGSRTNNNNVGYQAVHSNLIQVYDKPQNRYNHHQIDDYYRPMGPYVPVPNYERYQPSDPKMFYYGSKIPTDFPKPFYPNKDFYPSHVTTVTSTLPKRNRPNDEEGGFRTQTIVFDNSAPSSRCNYIRLNEKGFPLGNEKCGRNSNDILLPEDYPNNYGQLIMEHRKRYRVQSRSKRSSFDMSSSYGGYQDMPTCCAWQQTYSQNFGYNRNSYPNQMNSDRLSPMEYNYGSYNSRLPTDAGQNFNDFSDEETNTRKKGLSSFLNNSGYRGRERPHYDDRDDSEENEANKRRNHNVGYRIRNNSHSRNSTNNSFSNINRQRGSSKKNSSAQDDSYPNSEDSQQDFYRQSSNRGNHRDDYNYGSRQYTGGSDDYYRSNGYGVSSLYNRNRQYY